MKRLLPFYLLVILLFSCETDSYEKGQGKYSLMQADMGEVVVNSEKLAVAFSTDDGDNYAITDPVTLNWMQTADTTYRAVIYYNKVEAGQAELMGVVSVPTMKPVEQWRFKEQPQDPVGFESAWLSKNKKYINLGLLFKSGYVDEAMGTHLVSFAQDTVYVNADQTRTAYYRFLHGQNDNPEYFTNRHYLSILLPEDLPDTACVSIVTYSGIVERRFGLK
jgi:hypothetical protein